MTNAIITTQMPAQADNDAQVIEMWLSQKAPSTRAMYGATLDRFWTDTGVDIKLRAITAAVLIGWAQHLEALGLAPRSRNRMVATIKSLLTFAHRIGWLPLNVGVVASSAPVSDRRVARVMSEEEVFALIQGARQDRDRELLKFMYASGCRCSEVSALRWCDLERRERAGQAVLTGKGSKIRTVLVSLAVIDDVMKLRDGAGGDDIDEVVELRNGAGDDDPVFMSQRGGKAITKNGIHRIVVGAAKRAGIDKAVSPHWLRHAHASHSLDRGAKIHVLQATLGHTSMATTSQYVHARPDDSSGLHLAI